LCFPLVFGNPRFGILKKGKGYLGFHTFFFVTLVEVVLVWYIEVYFTLCNI
jgi:hypothetical protein